MLKVSYLYNTFLHVLYIVRPEPSAAALCAEAHLCDSVFLLCLIYFPSVFLYVGGLSFANLSGMNLGIVCNLDVHGAEVGEPNEEYASHLKFTKYMK